MLSITGPGRVNSAQVEDDSEGILLLSEVAWVYKQMTTRSTAQMGDQQH